MCVCVKDTDREFAERYRVRVKVVGRGVCLEREGECTERERERWKVCAERGKEYVLK